MAKAKVKVKAKKPLKSARRNIGEEMLQGIREMKAGIKPWHRVHHIEVPTALEARIRSGLSQQKFADVLGVSPRTLQDWEQGRREPSGAARSLLTIAARRPEVLKELFA